MATRRQLQRRAIQGLLPTPGLTVEQGTLTSPTTATIGTASVDVQRLSAFSQSLSAPQYLVVDNGRGFVI